MRALLPDTPSIEKVPMDKFMVSATLVDSLADDVKASRKSAQDAAKEMARQCVCGIFNPARAAKLLAALADVK